MNRLDRTMGILLLLRGGRVVSAADLAARFEVSVRTIYRDIEVLSGLGVPVAAEMGRTGGFSLREGYFLPPVTLSPEEAVSLIVGLTLMRRLRVMPFPAEADFAERKLLAALPEGTRRLMAALPRYIGFEKVPADLFHPEPEDPQVEPGRHEEAEGQIVGRFLKAILSRSRLVMRYRSPWRGSEDGKEVEALGILWDRDRWYLAGREAGRERLWRSDRVVSLGPGPSLHPVSDNFDIAELLDRRWLAAAMAGWRAKAPVRLAMTPAQAEVLRRDWYYGKALFEPEAGGGGRVVMVYGEDDPRAASRLVRWLGPGAELLEPAAWRATVVEELQALLAAHT